jgi:hypothetical protein
LPNSGTEEQGARATLEVKLRRKIRELHEATEETDSDKKEAESALHAQREYYERKQQERDANREEVEVSLYGAIRNCTNSFKIRSEP